MSDFLTNLTARSFGSAPNLLRPELPSLFESPTGSASLLDGEGTLSAYEEISGATSVPPFMAHHLRQDERGTNESDRDPISHAEHNRAARQTIAPYEPLEQMDGSIRIQHKDQAIIEPTVSIVKSSEEREQATSPRLVPVIPQLASIPESSQIDQDWDAEVAPANHHSSIVRISIGRIDVRAVTQTPAPARSAIPTRPKMTLDDYLHGRNEGKR